MNPVIIAKTLFMLTCMSIHCSIMYENPQIPEGFLYYMLHLFVIVLYIHTVDNILTLLIGNKSRWFQLHASINMCIVSGVFKDVILILENHDAAAEVSTDIYARDLALMLHVYHTLMFKLTRDDIFHHMFSVLSCVYPCHMFPVKAHSVFYMFATGFPGSITYSMLVLHKHGLMSKYTVKYLDSYINSYIRTPGLICAAYIFKCAATCNDPVYIHPYYCGALLYVAVINYYNGVYYGRLATDNLKNYVHKQQNRGLRLKLK
jgi:hypothetical protein